MYASDGRAAKNQTIDEKKLSKRAASKDYREYYLDTTENK